jgi:dienelactone hydrolase
MKKLFVILTLLAGSILFASAGKFVTYSVDGKDYEGYYISPSASAPLVFLVHDWDGLNDYEVKRAQMLYDMGYATFAVDMFGKGVKAETVDERKALTGALYKDREKMRKLQYGALKFAKTLGANVDNAVGIGYCFGGTTLLEFARSGVNFKAFVPFHGGLKTPEGQSVSTIKGEVAVFHGTADKAISMEEFATFANELENAKITHEMHTYSGAPHAFTNFNSQERYHEEADRKSWARFSAYLSEIFAK